MVCRYLHKKRYFHFLNFSKIEHGLAPIDDFKNIDFNFISFQNVVCRYTYIFIIYFIKIRNAFVINKKCLSAQKILNLSPFLVMGSSVPL